MSDETVEPAAFDPAAREFGALPADVSNLPPEELGRLLEDFRPYLMAIALAELPEALGGKVGASDVVQETILRGYENAAAFQGTTREEFAGWLRKILLNHLANVIKAFQSEKRDVGRERPFGGHEATSSRPSPSAQALNHEEWTLLEQALSQLPDEYRQAIFLRQREDLSFLEIGKRLNKSEEAARKVWTRAVKQLQEAMQRDDFRKP